MHVTSGVTAALATAIVARWKMVLPAAAAVLTLSVAGYVYLHRAPTLTEKDTIVLADFENRTGDPVFDDTLRQGLSVQLQQSPFLSLISDRQVQQTLTLMGQTKDARLTAEIAQQVCERTASAVFWKARSPALGANMYWACARGTATPEAFSIRSRSSRRGREDVLNSLSEIVRKLRTRLGESRATVEQHSTPLAEATTPSLEALKAYSTGIKANISVGMRTASVFSAVLSKSIPNSQSPTRIWDSTTAVLERRCCRLRAPQKPGNSRDEPATARSFSSTLPTTGRSREIWKSLPNARVVASDLSSRGRATKSPRFIRRPFHTGDRPI